jgi:hypothetical protein
MIGASGGFLMNRVTLKLENCYGIKKLETELDFRSDATYAIYAPNGYMKSSFAHTFRDIATGKKTEDRIFPDRVSRRDVKDEKGSELDPKSIFVVLPYDRDFEANDGASSLLVNSDLKQEHDTLLKTFEKSKTNLISALKKQSGSKKEIEKELSVIVVGTAEWEGNEDPFIRALIRLRPELEAQQDAPFSNVEYDTLFNDETDRLLEISDVKTAIDAYVKRYNQLLSDSQFFKRGIFEYYGASQIADALTKHGFFKANHTVNLRSNGKVREITNKKQLEEIIDDEKRIILTDTILRIEFDKLDKELSRNQARRDFRDYLMAHATLVPYLANVRTFKEAIWKSFLKLSIDLYRDLLLQYEAVSERVKIIEETAKSEITQWQEVINIFNARFVVPFNLEVKNQAQVMLRAEPIQLGFAYKEGNIRIPVDRGKLIDVLSTGEKKHSTYSKSYLLWRSDVRRSGKHLW